MTRDELLERGDETVTIRQIVDMIVSENSCGDCVSRDAVLDLVADYDLSMGQVVKCIHALPTVTLQPCEDAVSRQELLKAISTWDKFGCDTDTKLVPYKDHYVPYIHYDDVINCIKCMPSVSAQPKKWIPIETELPEVGIDVLVCDMEGTIYLSHRSSFDYYFDEWGNKIKNIRAWMQLPEPYKAEGSEE